MVNSFNSYLTEQEGLEPYKLVAFQHHGNIRDINETGADDLHKLMSSSAQSLDIDYHTVDFNGLYLTEKDSKLFVNSYIVDDNGVPKIPEKDGKVEYQKPIEINPDNTLILNRGISTVNFNTNRNWVDTMMKLELFGFKCIPSIKCWDMCGSKYFTDIIFKKNDLRTPKTIAISNSEDTERVMEELGNKFPVILKTSTGSQTGVGVVIHESMRSLKAAVQMFLLFERLLPILIQEYVKTEYDVRVIIHKGQVLGAMKRTSIGDDIRSNASLGAKVSPIELTELEKSECIKAASLVDGELVGADFIPSKDREKEKPIFIEMNAKPGFLGIESINKGLVKEILKHYLDRTNWS